MAKKKEAKTESTESTALTVISGGLLGNVDLNQLNTLIENIGTADKIEECDKKPAIEAIDTWEKSVINRIYQKINEIDKFVNKFEVIPSCFSNDDLEIFENIANQINTNKLYDTFKETYILYNDTMHNRPEKLPDDVTQTYEQQILDKKTYDYNYAVYELNVKKAQRKMVVAWNAFKEVMKNSDEVKRTLGEMKNYSKKLSKFQNECKDKAAYAKLNISIASAELRNALRDLLNFGLSI